MVGKRKFIFLFVLLACIAFLWGCSKTNEKTKDGVSSSNEIVLRFWRAGTDTETLEYWEGMVSRFNKEYPNVKVEIVSLPWGNEIETKLNAAYASGTAPDVLQYSLVSIPQRASVGQYQALDEYMAEWEGKNDIFPSILESGQYLGKTYGLGMRPDARMFVWRKDMFEKAGLDPEVPPKTWEELYEYAKKLTIIENNIAVQGGYSMSIANGFQDFQIFLMQNGGDFIDPETNELLYNSPAGVEALTFLNKLVKSGCVIPADQFQSGTDVFVSGKAAMAYKNPADIQAMILADPSLKDKIGMSAPLSRVKQSTFGGMGFMFMSADSKIKDIAWKFIEFSMSPEEVKIRAKDYGIPVVLDSLTEEYISWNPPMNKAVIESIMVGKGAYPVVFSNRLNEVVSMACEQAYYGEKTEKQALDDSVAAFSKEIPSLIN